MSLPGIGRNACDPAGMADDDDLPRLREQWGRLFEITFVRGMYRARAYGTQSAVSAPTAAGLSRFLGEDLIRPFGGDSPVDLRKLRASLRQNSVSSRSTPLRAS